MVSDVDNPIQIFSSAHQDFSNTADIDALDVTDAPGDEFGFRLFLDGFWRIRLVCNFYYADPAIGQAYLYLSSSDGAHHVGLLGEAWGGNPNKSFETVWVPANFGTDVFPFFWHNAGVDVNIAAFYLTAIYLGSYIGSPDFVM